MAKVSLRIYNREIESLIDKSLINEAIAHCHHILRTFPKHLATYRLLGKAYLELKRYNEAVDIFSRVLMAVPDDYVSHVGMSIIHDEERKMDEAIWHMERAFESQPSNAAIQGELQRLYGRRDGMEPPKIRMTRGALAHLYVQGELYPQAIAEIRAVLDQEPDRADMQVLLAHAYFRGGQKADASEMCAQLLKRYQYCFDANRIMVDLLPSTAGVAESTQVYRMRVGEMDPYATFAKGSVFQSHEVADAAINLERFEYKGEEEPAAPAWAPALGLGSGAVAATAASFSEPDWLKSGSSLETPQQTSEPTDEIPDFLRQAGWGESSAPEQPTSIFDEEPANSNLTPAELPDWLRGQVPVESTPSPAPQPEPAPAMEVPEWLLDAPQKEEHAQAGDAPAWLKEASQTPDESAQTGELPDWLKGTQQSAEPEQMDNTAGWLSGLESTPPPTEPTQADAAPHWLDELDNNKQPVAAEPADIPDWLSGAEDKQAQETTDTPDWLKGIASEDKEFSEATPSVENLGSTAEEQDEAVAWLESLAAKHGAKPEELVTDPNKRSEKPPEWVSQAQTLESSSQTPAAAVESLGSTAQEQDDAMAWLESLAAKHGAKPEELVTDPDKRSEKPPEWVSQAQSIGESQPEQKPEIVKNALNIGEQFFAEFESASSSTPVKDETKDWLEDLVKEDERLERSEIPEWLSDAQPPQDTGGQFEFKQQESEAQKSDLPNWLSDIESDTAPQAVTGQSMSEGDLANWLNSLDDEPGLPFESMPTPDSILFEAQSKPVIKSKRSEPVEEKSDLPDWLSDVDSQTVEANDEREESPIKPAESLPSWLQETDEDMGTNFDDDDTPPWRHRELWESEEAPPPAPTSPTDWHPLEPQQTEAKSRPKQEVQVDEANKPFVPPPPQPATQPVVASIPQPSTPAKKKVGLPARKQPTESANAIVALNQAKNELERGDIPAALAHYGKLIKRGKHIEETIRDLTESIYRYPVEVGIWQTLGDAYMRVNRLKEALESYNKAEELIR
jgi:tetratricopeptide (TPR) repeat protein